MKKSFLETLIEVNQKIDTPNLQEMMGYATAMSGSSSISIKVTKDGFGATFYEDRRPIVSAVGRSISEAIKNLEMAAIEFLGDSAI